MIVAQSTAEQTGVARTDERDTGSSLTKLAEAQHNYSLYDIETILQLDFNLHNV